MESAARDGDGDVDMSRAEPDTTATVADAGTTIADTTIEDVDGVVKDIDENDDGAEMLDVEDDGKPKDK